MARLSRLAVLPVLGVAAFGLGGCGVSVAELEDKVSSYASDNGMQVENVECPDTLDAEVDATTTCTVSGGGQDVEVDVEVTEVDGDQVELSMQGRMPGGE